MDKIGRKIQELRKSKSLTQEQLAELIGVSRQTIYKWESDYVQPSNENILKLCEIFIVNSNYFFDIGIDTITDKSDVASEKPKPKKHMWIISIVSIILTLIFATVTLCLGLITYQPTRSAMWVTTSLTNPTFFYVAVALTILLLLNSILITINIAKKT